MDTVAKLRDNFEEMALYKDLKESAFFSSLGLPSFMRDWLLQRFEDSEGNFDKEEFREFVRTHVPRRSDWEALKAQVVLENKEVRFLTKIETNIDINRGQVNFALPEFGLGFRETLIEQYVWDEVAHDLTKEGGAWGIVELGYQPAQDRDPGKILLRSFKNFCPYRVELDYFQEAREDFSLEEWVDILLGAIDYNPEGYLNLEEKLTMLTRLLPFVEKRLNLIELAPKGTGKSYLFGQISRFGWLSSGGKMTRAKMFYDMNTKREGLISGHDFVVLDEVQTIAFSDVDEMRAALKGYMESGQFTVGNYHGRSEAGVVLCGNLRKEIMDQDGQANMFQEVPPIFQESALIERFHGFIKGWNIPRIRENIKVSGWALNSEYFCSIMHELRSDTAYRAVVDEILEVPATADTRDTEAIKRIATAYLKLLFPHVRRANQVPGELFRHYCLERAMEMRQTIVTQLGLLDNEYRGKRVPALELKPQFRSSKELISNF